MVLPFVTIGSKLVFCSLADRHRAYRLFFIIFLVCALIGYGSFAVLPFLVTPPAKEAGLSRGTFVVICIMTSIATISMSVLSCLSDAFAMNSSRKYNTSYGLIRLWGTLGWGASALLLTYVNQYNKLPFLVPGLLMMIVLIVVDITVVAAWANGDDFKLDKSASDFTSVDVIAALAQGPGIGGTCGGPNLADDSTRLSPKVLGNYGAAKEDNNKRPEVLRVQESGVSIAQGHEFRIDIDSVKMQWILFKEVSRRRRSIFRYMTLFTISGALISLQWSYFFLYLEQIYQSDFTYISGLSMFGQSMLGELPFFILSQYVIKLLGRSHSLSISIASIGIRYLLYEYLLPNSSMYFVLLTETLQGPSFGLFYVVMTEVGLDYSDCEEAIVSVVAQGIVANDPNQIDRLRQALRATLQSLMSACYEGLGVGIGSIVGGLVIDYFKFTNLWFYSSWIAITLGLINTLIDVSGIPIFEDKAHRIMSNT